MQTVAETREQPGVSPGAEETASTGRRDFEGLWDSIASIVGSALTDQGNNEVAERLIRYHLANPGKRLRSRFVTGFYGLFADRPGDDLLSFAASVELLHNASLVHDDLEDYDFFRRGRPALWREFSPSQAINAGDLLFALSASILTRSRIGETLKLQLISLLIEAVRRLAKGQILELSSLGRDTVSREVYESVADGKTGSIFELLIRGALLIAGRYHPGLDGDVSLLGRSLGRVYQMRDDIVDILGLKEGRKRGGDIMANRMTILTVLAHESPRRVRDELTAVSVESRRKGGADMVGKVFRIYRKEGILGRAFQVFHDDLSKINRIGFVRDDPEIARFFGSFLELFEIPEPSWFGSRVAKHAS